MEKVIGRGCYGFKLGEDVPYAVSLEVHQADCPHVGEPGMEDELLDHMSCMVLGGGEDRRCPHAQKITMDENNYTCICV